MSDDIAADLRAAAYRPKTTDGLPPSFLAEALAERLTALASKWPTIAAVLDAAEAMAEACAETEAEFYAATDELLNAVRAYREASAPSSPQGEHQ